MNTIGRKFRVSIFGESHGELIGVVLDGVPAGLELCEQDFEQDILRRKSGAKGTTPRIESDRPTIVSGIFEGHTTGAPLTVIFRNGNTHSSDYELFAAMPRPGHADLTAALKWDDCQDPRGGGHFSGRLTLPIVAAGVVAKKILSDATMLDETPFTAVNARIVELGGIPAESLEMTKFETADPEMPAGWQEAVDQAIKEGDSLGAKKNFPIFIHETAMQFPFIYVSAGERGLQLKIAPADLVKARRCCFESHRRCAGQCR